MLLNNIFRMPFFLSRVEKKLLLTLVDVSILTFSWGLLLSWSRAAGGVFGIDYFIFLLSWLVGLHLAKVYRTRLRYLGFTLAKQIVYASLLPLFLIISLKYYGRSELPLDTWAGACLVAFNGLTGFRVLVRQVYFHQFVRSAKKLNVMILGTSDVSVEFAKAALSSTEYNVMALVDIDGKDDSAIHGINVVSISDLEKIESTKFPSLFLIPANIFGNEALIPIINFANHRKISIKKIPAVSDLMEGKFDSQRIKDLDVEDILPRADVQPDTCLLSDAARGKTILITGAAGSIGSQIAISLVGMKPKKLVLLDNNEFGIYALEQSFIEGLNGECDARFIVDTICDRDAISALFEEESFDAVYHAAAYKHVPLVEDNPFSAVRVNVEGTRNLVEEAVKAKVPSFTLISSDKAVRPTNIMGATKRMAELICSELAQSTESTTISMVRFGNVMNSSGSVIPKFRSQIEAGGPVTVTHPDIIRYFMSIREAADLVVQASALAQGGEVFLLDMGEPVLLKHLAESLISLAGKIPVYDKTPGINEIKIVFTGLRAGEKMYEELLVTNESVRTTHPKINKAFDSSVDKASVVDLELNLRSAVENRDTTRLTNTLKHPLIGLARQPNPS